MTELITNSDIPKDVHIIIRFLLESQIKHSFVFNSEIQKKINICLNYLINKIVKKRKKSSLSKKKIQSELYSAVTNSINIEKIINENSELDHNLVKCLENTIKFIKK